MMAAGRPSTKTNISQHTLWTALSGENPLLPVPPTPIAHAVLDSRDVTPGDLFVALAGASTDGHNFIGAALANGAQAVIAEERGLGAAKQAGAAIVDCTRGRWALTAQLPAGYRPEQPIVYLVDDSIVGTPTGRGIPACAPGPPGPARDRRYRQRGQNQHQRVDSQCAPPAVPDSGQPGQSEQRAGVAPDVAEPGAFDRSGCVRDGDVRSGGDRAALRSGSTPSGDCDHGRASALEPSGHHRAHRPGQGRTGAGVAASQCGRRGHSQLGRCRACRPWPN